MTITLPIKLVSPNTQEHWTKRHKRNKMIKMLVKLEYSKLKVKPVLPCHIKITKIAPRAYDEDNMIASCKSLIDTCADLLIPNLAAGRADADPKISFSYNQERGKPKEYKVRIDFESDILGRS